MNPITQSGAQKLALGVERGIFKLRDRQNLEVILCPPFPYLSNAKGQMSNIAKLGAQNCHFEDSGAFTGEISAKMLEDLGCKYVIVGHSERRAMGEDDVLINKKIKVVLKNNMRPVLAVGEKTRDSFDKNGRWTGEVDATVGEQIRVALKGVSPAKARKVIVAYEPVWAISKGFGKPTHTPETDDVFAVKIFIQKILRQLYSPAVQKNIPIIYGGSTNSQNIVAFIRDGHMEGALVGGASLKAEEFVKMAEKVTALR